MELSSLAAKQKRLKTWTEFAHSSVQCETLKLKILDSLKDYRNLLAKCWENNSISDDDVKRLSGLERELSQLNEEARMTVIGIKTVNRN